MPIIKHVDRFIPWMGQSVIAVARKERVSLTIMRLHKTALTAGATARPTSPACFQ